MNRRHRLTGRRAFGAVRARRSGASSGALRVAIARNAVPLARIGFIIPRQVGDAVSRNRLRRRLRALLRPQLATLAGIDVVVGARAEATGLGPAELDAQLATCLMRARHRLDGDQSRRMGDNASGAVRPAASQRAPRGSAPSPSLA